MTAVPPDSAPLARIEVHHVDPPSVEKPPPPFWKDLINSTVGAAVVTAVIGGVFGQIIVTQYQAWQKAKEAAQLAQKERLTAQRLTVERAADVVAEGGYHAASLLELTFPEMQISAVAVDDQDEFAIQRAQIRQAVNGYEARWKRERVKIGILLRYQFSDRPEVLPAWQRCTEKLDALSATANAEYDRYSKDPAIASNNPHRSALAEPEKNLDEALSAFLVAVNPAATPRSIH